MARQNRDLNKTASRFLNALRRITAGIEIQQQRIIDRSANAPRLLGGGPIEVINLTGDPGNDLDYYIYELGRLSETGNSIITIYGPEPELDSARDAFHAAIPNLKRIRHPLTHPNDNDELDAVAWFSSVVNLKSDGSVEDLVDPRYEQHDAALAYSAALTTYLRHQVQVAIANDPAAPLKEQIRQRTQQGETQGRSAADTQASAAD